jgi:hypothetical protein
VLSSSAPRAKRKRGRVACYRLKLPGRAACRAITAPGAPDLGVRVQPNYDSGVAEDEAALIEYADDGIPRSRFGQGAAARRCGV